MTLSIQNRQRRVPVSAPRLRRLVARALSALSRSDRDIHLTLVDDREIRRLNRRYLGARRPTDVLAFDLELGVGPRAALDQARAPGPSPARARRNRAPGRVTRSASAAGNRPRVSRLLGEVIISAETAARQATRLRIPVALEMDLLLVHGLLHLSGYDDHTPDEARVMHERAREILSHGRRRPLPPRMWAGLLPAL